MAGGGIASFLRSVAGVVLFVGVTIMPSGAAAGEITVFAAASLKTAMDEVTAAFENRTGHDLTVSHAGSSALARQIERGAPADVFISANTGWMDRLEEAGWIEPGTRTDLLGNRMVLIKHGSAELEEIGPEFGLARLLGNGRLAMALIDAVPAGIYGKTALENLGLWDAVADRVVQADNVRAALKLVSLGEASLGVVYATDAAADERVSVLGIFPEESHPPIIYPFAVVKDRETAAVADFLNFLGTAEARSVFDRQGFAVLGE